MPIWKVLVVIGVPMCVCVCVCVCVRERDMGAWGRALFDSILPVNWCWKLIFSTVFHIPNTTDINPVRPNNAYKLSTWSRLNKKPVVQNLLHVFSFLIDISYFFLASKTTFSIVLKMPTFRSWCVFFYCEIFDDFYKVNITFYIVSNISKWTPTGLKQLDYPCIAFFVWKCIKYDTSGFWGTFICSSFNHHCSALHYMYIEWHLYLYRDDIYMHFYVCSMCVIVFFLGHINISNCTKNC